MTMTRVSRAAEIEQRMLSQLTELAGPDNLLPTEEKLCERYGVSRTTIRSALAALAARGLIVRRQGMGNFISRGARIANPLDQILDFCEMIECNGHQPGIEFLSAAIKYPSDEVAAALQRPDELVVERRTVFTADGAPVIYCVNSIPLGLLPGALAREVVADPSISEPIFRFFEQRCSLRIEYRTGRVWPEIARDIQAFELAVFAGRHAKGGAGNFGGEN